MNITKILILRALLQLLRLIIKFFFLFFKVLYNFFQYLNNVLMLDQIFHLIRSILKTAHCNCSDVQEIIFTSNCSTRIGKGSGKRDIYFITKQDYQRLKTYRKNICYSIKDCKDHLTLHGSKLLIEQININKKYSNNVKFSAHIVF